MRNLRNVRYCAAKTEKDASAVCWDSSSDDIIVAHGPTHEDAKIELTRVRQQTISDP